MQKDSEMKFPVIINIAQVTAAWLTTVLRASGALSDGHVVSIELHGNRATWAHNARITPAYSAEATGERPEALLLKMEAAALLAAGFVEVDRQFEMELAL